MTYSVTGITLDELPALRHSAPDVVWSSPFVLPVWLRVWRDSFKPSGTDYIRLVRDGQGIAGVAPLLREDDTVRFLGATDVCDYQDIIAAPGKERDVCAALLENCLGDGVRMIDLAHIRPDSIVYS